MHNLILILVVLKSLVSQVLDVVGDQFDEEEAQRALKLHSNNVDKAVNYLLEQSSSTTTKGILSTNVSHSASDDLFEMEMEQPKSNQTKEPSMYSSLSLYSICIC